MKKTILYCSAALLMLTYRRMNPDLEIPLARTLVDEAFEAFVEQLELYRDEIVHTDLRAAAKMVNYFVNVIFLDRIVFVNSPLQDSIRPDDDTLIAAYTDMVFGYLTQSHSAE
ncbi:MAG: hypothetical protein AAF633_15455 [Chloroflexota bacterium]